MRLRRVALAALAAMSACAALLGACAGKPNSNVILIVVDTLRADHLSLAGYTRPTSPRLAEYARRGTYFDRFHSHSSWTRPSVATLLTSLLPRSHGIVTSGDALPRSLTTLPELLQVEGFRTFAFVANPQIHPQLGFDEGFDRFFELYRSDANAGAIVPEDVARSASDAEVLSKALDVLLHTRRSPWFAYIHLLDPHGPYTPDPADAALFSDPSYAGKIDGSIGDFALVDQLGANPADLARFEALYDGEIRGTDRDLGAFLDALGRAGQLEKTHVLVTADHGEEFLEHGSVGHGRKLYEESIHIPLLWLGPGIPQGKTVHELGGLVDILPTLLDVLGIPAIGLPLQGRSLRPLWSGASPEPGRALLLEEYSGKDEVVDGRSLPFVGRGLILGMQKLLVQPVRLDRHRIEKISLFDLAADPGERAPRTLSPDSSTWSRSDAELVGRYVRLDRETPALASGMGASADSLPDEDLERLRSLGYLD